MHQGGLIKYVCKKCGEKFRSKYNFNKHLREVCKKGLPRKQRMRNSRSRGLSTVGGT